MKIAFDSQVFTIQEYGGISRYICSLAQQLTTHHDVEAKIFAPLHINAYLKHMPCNLVCGVRVPRIPKTGKIVSATSRIMASAAIRLYKPEIVHETYYSNFSFAPKNVRCIITLHDMIHERFSSTYPKNDHTSDWKKKSLLRADHIICVSEHTKRDLLNFIQIPAEKVSVVHHGFDKFKASSSLHGSTTTIPTLPYLLYVGSRWGYKNFDGLLRAYASSAFLKNNVRIVCFGGGALKVDELALMQSLGISLQQVAQVSGSDEQLAGYYEKAAAFIYPSLYEGFGIPPLEAMSLSCPVICSNTSSVPEVVGDAAEYFDPKSIESIATAIEAVLESREKQDDLILKGIERCAIFTWARCAKETLAIYQKVIN